MKELKQMYFKNPSSFRKWLAEHFDQSPGVWMVFYKKKVSIKGISYAEALDEALCYGWIDSIVKKIDEEKYVRKFSPRRNISNWSEVNKKKVLDLLQQGKMTAHGLQKIDSYLKTGKLHWDSSELQKKQNASLDIPAFMLKEFSENEPALKNFNLLAKSYQRQYIQWITEAKRDATQQKRLKASITLLKENKKWGM